MELYHNLHTGFECYILANGPSLGELTPAQLEKLKLSITIGTNSSYKLIKSQYHWFADTQAEDMHFDDLEFITHLPFATHCFAIDYPSKQNPPYEDVTFVKHIGGQGFSDDLNKGIFGAYTVSHPALQFAVWLGCNPITFVGLDLCTPNGKENFTTKDFVHAAPLFKGMNETLTQCTDKLKAEGIEVYNASPYYTFGTIPKGTI